MKNNDESNTDSPSAGGAPERTLRLLSLLARSGRALSLAELCAQLEMAKPTLHRLCGQLVAQGFLAHEVGARSYTTGPALRALALDTLHNAHESGRRHQHLKQLVAKVGETCNFTTLDGASVLYLDRVEAPWPWRLSLDVGTRVPLHCTASGKLFLAHLDAPRRDALMAQLPLPRLTANTLTTRRALRSECEAIARQGHSLDREEFIAGLMALAVPVRDAQGAVRAAIAVHAPVARLTADAALARLPALQAAAQRMGELL